MALSARNLCITLLAAFAALTLDASATAAAESSTTPPVTRARAESPRFAGDPLAVRGINPSFETFPDSSLVDFSFLLDSPAGKHGFVQIDDKGHFKFEKTGKRARFWGMTVAADHVGNIEKARIATVVDVMARGGCNLLRLHEMDNRGGEQYNLVRRNIIDEAYPNNNKSTEFDAEYRDRVDWWIACAQKKGMYVYLVVRGYRTFREGDGVPNADKLDRAAKPYAFFDPRLIELQKQYADDFLFKHTNPYTGIPNGVNPAVCMLEIENEDSLLYAHKAWREFPEPYRANFQRMWNGWLRETYGSTDGLRKAWTNAKGECALGDGESVEDGTVLLPGLETTSLEKLKEIPWTDPKDSPARNNDGVRFAMKVQDDYFRTMSDFLKSKGAKMPHSAVVHGGVLGDTFSCAKALGSTAENAYLDHPGFLPGAVWVGKPYFTDINYLKNDEMAMHMARYKWAGAALVCREWTTCWPNQYRASAFTNMAAHASVQDYDMLIHFAYYTWGMQDTITAFGPQADPPRWGMNGYAALMFLTGAVPPEEKVVRLAYNDADLATHASWYRPLQKLGAFARTENWNPDQPLKANAADKDVALTVVSGRSGTGKYDGGNLVLFDPNYAERAAMPEAERRKGVLAQSGYDFPWIYSTDGFPTDEVKKAGFKPFGVKAEATPTCSGFVDEKRGNLVLGKVDEEEAVAGALARLGRLPINSTEIELSGGAVRRDPKQGTLRVATERVCAIAGELKSHEVYAAGALEVSTSSPVACVAAVSLDGRPLAESRRLSVKMVTVARNRGQELKPVPEGEPGGDKFVLAAEGNAPVQTLGAPCEVPTVVKIGGRPVVEAHLINGTWEVVADLDRKTADVACDTVNVRFVLGRDLAAPDAPITKFFTEHPPEDAGQKGNDFVYPGFAKYVRVGGAASD